MIKLLVILDKKISEDPAYVAEIAEALGLQDKEYREATDGDIGVEHTFATQDLSAVPWVDYWAGNYGFSYQWLQQDTKNRGDFYSIAYVIDDEHWSRLGITEGIWGWHAGFFNGYSVQLIRAQKGNKKYVPALGITANNVFFGLYEELMHSWDDFIYSKLQVDLDDFFGVKDYDETIVHGADAYDNWQRWKYQEAIKAIKPFLMQLFNTMNLYREKGREGIYWKLNEKYIWVSYQRMVDLVADGLVKWSDVGEIDEKIIQEGVLA